MYQKNESIFQNNKKAEPVEPIQMNIYHINICKNNCSWLYFDNEQRVQERQQVRNQQSYISVFVAYMFPDRDQDYHPHILTVFQERLYGRFIEIQSNLRRKKLCKMNQRSNFLGGNFSNGDNVRASLQFRRESQNTAS